MKLVLILAILGLGIILYLGESYSIVEACKWHKLNDYPEPGWRVRCEKLGF